MASTIGNTLREQRDKRGFSLDDAMKATHIRMKYLEAMENDRFDLLPSGVQSRGFLRLYAEYLGLPADRLVRGLETGQLEMDAPIEETETRTVGETQRFAPAQNVFPSQPPAAATGSAEIFQNIGQELRRQREKLGLALNDIEQYTHIRQFYLQAIELGKVDQLPSPVQAKGMIQSYAQFLDLNSDDVLLSYAEGLQLQREEKLGAAQALQKPRRSNRPEKQTLLRRFLTPDLLVGSVVILALVAFAIWSTSRVIASRNAAAQTTIPGISEVLASTSTLPILAAVPATGTQSAATPQPESTYGLSTPENAGADATDPQGASPTIGMTSDAPLQVYVVAHQRAYLKVVADDEIEYEGRVVPGNAYPFSGEESIELLTGNAAALQIFFNQVDLGTIGAYGQVVDLIFRQEGVITPTPQFTATATPTTPATITLAPSATPITPSVTPFIP